MHKYSITFLISINMAFDGSTALGRKIKRQKAPKAENQNTEKVGMKDNGERRGESIPS